MGDLLGARRELTRHLGWASWWACGLDVSAGKEGSERLHPHLHLVVAIPAGTEPTGASEGVVEAWLRCVRGRGVRAARGAQRWGVVGGVGGELEEAARRVCWYAAAGLWGASSGLVELVERARTSAHARRLWRRLWGGLEGRRLWSSSQGERRPVGISEGEEDPGEDPELRAFRRPIDAPVPDWLFVALREGGLVLKTSRLVLALEARGALGLAHAAAVDAAERWERRGGRGAAAYVGTLEAALRAGVVRARAVALGLGALAAALDSIGTTCRRGGRRGVRARRAVGGWWPLMARLKGVRVEVRCRGSPGGCGVKARGPPAIPPKKAAACGGLGGAKGGD